MENMVFYDTNALLALRGDAFKSKFVISQKTLEEIENIKTSKTKDEETRYKARKVAHLLDEKSDMYEVVFFTDDVFDIIHKIGLAEATPDNIIVASAKKWQNEHSDYELMFVTDDINCRNTARRVFGLNTVGATVTEDIYKGYKLLRGNTAQLNEEMSNPDFKADFVTNEYLLTYNDDTGDEGEMRFDGENFVPLKLPPSKFIKGRNALQRCALDALMNKDITVLTIISKPGGGKTFMALNMAIYAIKEKGYQSKIIGVREPFGEGHDVGYLQGSFEEKTDNFFEPLADQLNGGTFELQSLKQQGVLETSIPFYIKGRTFNNSIMYCDEAEDLTMKQIRMIGTRVGENSRIFFTGDYKQSLIDTSTSNPLIEMCNAFKGKPNFACVCLNEDVRSETSKMFADMSKS